MKMNYINPEVMVSNIETVSVICASPVYPASGSGKLNSIETDDQW